MRQHISPRRFMPQARPLAKTIAAAVACALIGLPTHGDDVPKNVNPRAIFGDFAEPDWEQRMTVSVGPEKADLVGTTDRVIQAAVDYVARKGGGTVRVLPGRYRLRNSIFLAS